MAFTSGTATDYLDLLNRLKQFVTQDMLPANERWSVLRWVPGPPAELVLQGPGLAGTDQINVGILSEAGADYGNWKLRGFVESGTVAARIRPHPNTQKADKRCHGDGDAHGGDIHIQTPYLSARPMSCK